jgi:hypothetical protein
MLFIFRIKLVCTAGILLLLLITRVSKAIPNSSNDPVEVQPIGQINYKEGAGPRGVCPKTLSSTQKLPQNYVLCVPKNSSAQLKCPDREKRYLKGYRLTKQPGKFEQSIGAICGSLPNPRGPEDILAGGFEQSIPYIISPRYTWLRPSLCTDFKWNGVLDEATYKIELYKKNNEKIFSDRQTLKRDSNTKIVKFKYCPDNQFAPNESYRLIVTLIKASGIENSSNKEDDLLNFEAEYTSSRREGVSELTFRVIDQAENNKIREDIKVYTTNPDYSEEDKEVAVAVFYSEKPQYLYSEAIDKLEILVENSNLKHNSNVYRILGDLYADSGLNCLAYKRYQDAINTAKQQGAPEQEEQAKNSLSGLKSKAFRDKAGNKSTIGEKLPRCSN